MLTSREMSVVLPLGMVVLPHTWREDLKYFKTGIERLYSAVVYG